MVAKKGTKNLLLFAYLTPLLVKQTHIKQPVFSCMTIISNSILNFCSKITTRIYDLFKNILHLGTIYYMKAVAKNVTSLFPKVHPEGGGNGFRVFLFSF